MFNFFKRRQQSGQSSNTPWDDPDFDLYEQVSEHTYDVLDRQARRVDSKRRKFVWRDGSKLSIRQVASRLHAAKPDMPLELIDRCVTEWLEEAYEPKANDDEKLEKIELRIEAWIEDHQASEQTAIS